MTKQLMIRYTSSMGDECEKFLKNLAESLAKGDGEEYSDVMMSLRTMLSFHVVRAGHGDFGHRTSSDFGLSLV